MGNEDEDMLSARMKVVDVTGIPPLAKRTRQDRSPSCCRHCCCKTAIEERKDCEVPYPLYSIDFLRAYRIPPLMLLAARYSSPCLSIVCLLSILSDHSLLGSRVVVSACVHA